MLLLKKDLLSMLPNGYQSFNSVDLDKPLNDDNLVLEEEKGLESCNVPLLAVILTGVLFGVFV